MKKHRKISTWSYKKIFPFPNNQRILSIFDEYDLWISLTFKKKKKKLKLKNVKKKKKQIICIKNMKYIIKFSKN